MGTVCVAEPCRPRVPRTDRKYSLGSPKPSVRVPATVRARFEARRVVAPTNVYVSYRPRQKPPCPECGEPVGCRANECPGCGYDFKAAREAPAPVSLTRRGAATLGVRIKLGGRVAPGRLVASVRAEPAQRRGSARRHAPPVATTRTTATRRRRRAAARCLRWTDELTKAESRPSSGSPSTRSTFGTISTS